MRLRSRIVEIFPIGKFRGEDSRILTKTYVFPWYV